jgi:hypothetical protein
MKLLRQWMGWYLVLCLAGGAAVGFSPVLHQIIEHAGVGLRHSHPHALPGSRVESRAQDRGLGNGHAHNHVPSQAGRGRIAIQPHGHFHWPKLSLDPWRRMVAALLDEGSEAPVPEQGTDHEHHSIFQLLAQGVVDQNPEAFPVLRAPLCPILSPSVSPEHIFYGTWEAQFAPRGPPFVRG